MGSARWLAIVFLPVMLARGNAGAQSERVPSPTGVLLTAVVAARDRASATGDGASTLHLAPGDRDALAFWLAAHGRGPLHARGLSDRQIGVPFFPIDYAIVPAPWPATVATLPPAPVHAPIPAATQQPAPLRRSFLGGLLAATVPDLPINIPVASTSSSSSSTIQNADGSISQTTSNSGASVNVGVNPWAVVGALIDATSAHNVPEPPSVPWRSLVFGASRLGARSSTVVVTRGFAAVRNDGTEGVACISFTNNASQSLREVDVDIEIIDKLGFIKRVAPLRRAGLVAAGASAGGPENVQDVASARGNCVIDGENTLTDLTDPFAGAAAILYAVRSVAYADGSTWLQPGANPWPLTAQSRGAPAP